MNPRQSFQKERAARRAAPKPARIPLGAAMGHEVSSGQLVPGAELPTCGQRGLQGRPTVTSDEGLA